MTGIFHVWDNVVLFQFIEIDNDSKTLHLFAWEKSKGLRILQNDDVVRVGGVKHKLEKGRIGTLKFWEYVTF